MSTAYVSRDCFARGEYLRQCMGAGTCQWCGQKRKRVFSYTWESDSRKLKEYELNHDTFCNLECFNSYHLMR